MLFGFRYEKICYYFTTLDKMLYYNSTRHKECANKRQHLKTVEFLKLIQLINQISHQKKKKN